MQVSDAKLGLLGKNISYSKSPEIHNFSAKILGRSGSYELFDIDEDNVSSFLESCFEKGLLGLNVTTPYKNLAAKLVSSPLSSVNTLYRMESGWGAASTDGAGFLEALSYLSLEPASLSQVVILGSGGVVDALLSCLRGDQGAGPEVTVVRRHSRRDDDLKNQGKGLRLSFEEMKLPVLRSILEGKGRETLLVQATAAPHRGDNLSHLLPALRGYEGCFMDLVYGKTSALLGECLRRRLPATDGLAMLAGQAMASQKLWWGESVPFKDIYGFLRAQS